MNFEQIKQLYPEIGNCTDVESAFTTSCEGNNLDLASKLYENCEINLAQIYLDFLFVSICQNANLPMAMWLKSIYPQIDHTFEYSAIQFSIYKLNDNIVKWLISIWPLDKIEPVIYLCYSHNYFKIIKYIIRFFDITHLQFTGLAIRCQKQFDDDIEHYRDNNKSAAKI